MQSSEIFAVNTAHSMARNKGKLVGPKPPLQPAAFRTYDQH